MNVAGIACVGARQVLLAAQPPPALQLQGVPACRNHPHIFTRRQLAASFNDPRQLQSVHAHLHSSSRQVTAASAAKPAAGLSCYGAEEAGHLLQWSFDEQQQQPLHAAAQPTVQQKVQPAARKHQRPLQGAECKDSTASARPRAAPTAQPVVAQPGTADMRRYRRSGQGSAAGLQQQQQQQRQQQRQQQQGPAADAADGYAAAQQRVRQLLVSADINSPEAAAAALPDTVNDIVIALQLLATAPKPPGLAAAKQYDAAVQQLAAAVVHKFTQLLLREQQQQQQHQKGQQLCQQQQLSLELPVAIGNPGSSSSGTELAQQPAAAAAAAAQEVQSCLASALAGLPATKLAAAAFSLGVLRHYDTQLVPAMEQGSLQLMLSSSSSSTDATAAQAKACTRQQQQQQHQQGFRPARFNANQLGQLAQGFVYLDHELSPAWQAAFLQACRKQMQHMKAPQLASIAAFLLRYRLCSSSSSRIRRSTAESDSLLAQLSSTSRLLNSSSSSSSNAALTFPAVGIGASHLAALLQQPAAAAAAAGRSSSDVTWQLYSGWSEAYLAASAQQARALKPQHLVLVLQAAAGLYQQHMQLLGADVPQPQQQQQQPQQQQQQQPQQRQQNVSDGGGVSVNSSKQRSRMAAARAFGGLPLTMPAAQQQASAVQVPAGHNGSSSSSSSGRVWLLPLLLSFQQQLPDLKMQHLAAVLPALAQLTMLPWPRELAKLLLLQLRLLLPAASGPDAVTAAAAAACVVQPGEIAADGELHYALLQRLHAVMPTLGPGGLAAAVRTLAVLQIKPYRAWVYELCARLRVEGRSMSAPEVLAVLEGLAALRVLLDPEVLHICVLGVQRGLGSMGRDDLCRTVAALRRMYPRVLPGRTVAQLVEEMERRAALFELQNI